MERKTRRSRECIHHRSCAAALALLATLVTASVARAEEADSLATPPDSTAAATTDSVPALPPPRLRAWQTGLLRNDRLQHFTLSVTLGVGIGLATREPWAGGAGAMTLGFAKELADRRSGRRFDLVDLAADALGATVGALIVQEVIR